MRIFVTQPLLGPALDRMRQIGAVRLFEDASRICPRDLLLEEAARCDVLCCLLHDRVDRAVIEAGAALKLIVTGVVNPAMVDLKYAAERKIPVTCIPNFVAESTADLQFSLLLACARRVVEADGALRGGLFPGSQSIHFAGGEVNGQTLGTVGLGAIGQCVARRARGFGLRVLYTKRHRLSPAEEQELGVEYVSLEELLRQSDFVTLNASYSPELHHLIGERELALMKPAAYLINTARGPMVDEAALVQCLRAGRIAGAALDVFEQEPAVHPDLIGLSNTVLTPHIGTATRPIRERIGSVMADNLEAFARGKPLPNLFPARP